MHSSWCKWQQRRSQHNHEHWVVLTLSSLDTVTVANETLHVSLVPLSLSETHKSWALMERDTFDKLMEWNGINTILVCINFFLCGLGFYIFFCFLLSLLFHSVIFFNHDSRNVCFYSHRDISLLNTDKLFLF